MDKPHGEQEEAVGGAAPNAGRALLMTGRRRRWWQYGLRSLFVLTLLCAAGAFAWRTYLEPYRQQRQTMALIETLGGSYKTAEANTPLRWLNPEYFQNIVVVDLGDCDDPATYLEHVATLPAVEALAVGGSAFTDQDLHRLQGLKKLRGLVLDTTSVTDEGLAALRALLPDIEVYRSQRRAIAAIPKRSGISSVSTAPTSSHSELKQLLGDSYFREAVGIAMNLTPLHDKDIEHIQVMSSLQQLLIDDTQVTDDGLALLRDLGHLQSLYVGGTAITDAGLAHLSALNTLANLSLRATAISDAGLAHLQGMSNLWYLGLGGTRITDAGLAHLKGLHNLGSLSLRQTQVTDAGLLHVKAWPNLSQLFLDGTRVSDAGLAHLTRLTGLRELGLEATQIGDDGLAHLEGLRELRVLRLRGTQVGDSGLVHLKGLSDLHDLELGSTQIGDSGLVHLKGLQKLGRLGLTKTRVTSNGFEKLRRALPKCRIEWP